ncbi:MAG: DUF5819 family protein [Firmicutes bacterium]|nr:DUF5819 family protein [Bacillota bacterium]
MKRFPISAPLLWAGLLALTLIIHFFITFLYLTPNNPVKTRHGESLFAYMDPLFAQNWKLFAPNPVSHHRDVQAKARVIDPDTGQLRETDWKDLTGPLIREKQAHRLSSEDRVTRYFVSGSRSFQEDNQKQKKTGEWMLQRAASTALGQAMPDQKIKAIKFRVVTNTFPRFDVRHKSDDSTPLHFRESNWLPYRPVGSGAAKGWPQ